MPCCAEEHDVGPAIPCGAVGGGLQVQHQVDIGPIKLMVTNNGMGTTSSGASLWLLLRSSSYPAGASGSQGCCKHVPSISCLGAVHSSLLQAICQCTDNISSW